TRAASICRLVIQAGSRACRPYSPKITSVPPLARPFKRPRCSLRNLVRLGISMSLASFRLFLLLRKNLAAINPHFHADPSIGGMGFRKAVINVRPQRVKGNRPFRIAFRPGDIGTAEASAHLGAHPFGPGPKRPLNGLFHRAAEGNAAF